MMIVLNKLILLHIPRTAGNSLIRAIAPVAMQHHDVLVSTVPTTQFAKSGVHRHITLTQLLDRYPFLEGLPSYAVRRPDAEIIESDYRLHLASDIPSLDEEWDESVRLARTETLEQFTERRWRKWTAGKSVWEHWTGPDTISLPFSDIQAAADVICRELDIPTPEIKKYDWQKDKLCRST